ncbi:hypothetical protein [Eubacterium sp. 1001713B170207_170306_E7]|uniref:hypothetical protein n=1 Tax=Eubacterium sp. 1001713B170207_170306_E7 TaxID=2787097 RepID=UPI0018980DB0|nr:hypothetical protein [Eubacterium sp. 1001713B170207_170306_E7]
MKLGTAFKYKTITIIIFTLAVLPTFEIASLEVPMIYIAMPLVFTGGLVFLAKDNQISKRMGYIYLFFIMVIFEIFLTSTYGSIKYFDHFSIRFDVINYACKFMVCIFFISLSSNQKIGINFFIKCFICVGIFAMFVGIVEWIPGVGREFFMKMYPFHDDDYLTFNRAMVNFRSSGIAQHATSNGGLAAFFFVFSVLLLKHSRQYKVTAGILAVISILNVFASQARAGMLAVLFAIIFMYLLEVIVDKRKVKNTFRFLFICLLIWIVFFYLYKINNPVVVKMFYRWNVLFETSGGGRVDQLIYFKNLLKTPFQYLFGLSKILINDSSISYGVEIEFASIFFAYGLIGVILQYGLVIIVLKNLYHNIKKSTGMVSFLQRCAFITLIVYQVFGIGYFFFREIRCGFFPWILIGFALGSYEKYKKSLLLNAE